MKLQKQKTGEGDRGPYYKYVLVLPQVKIESAGFKEGEELEAEVKGNQIIIKKLEKKTN
ncbi:MAG: AbrB/MazE/SpoVT family DNA-binding domain-containing protein [Nanoarchaeota archaeon]